MDCPSCTTANPDGAKECAGCGAILSPHLLPKETRGGYSVVGATVGAIAGTVFVAWALPHALTWQWPALALAGGFYPALIVGLVGRGRGAWEAALGAALGVTGWYTAHDFARDPVAHEIGNGGLQHALGAIVALPLVLAGGAVAMRVLGRLGFGGRAAEQERA